MYKLKKNINLLFAKLLKKIKKYVIIMMKKEKNRQIKQILIENNNIEIIKEELKGEKLVVMCKASEVGKIVINKCIDLNLSIDVQKLQKLLVLMQVECIQRSGKQLFKEDVRVWDCGVAIKEVDEDFRFQKNAFLVKHFEYINLLDIEEECVDYVLREYGHMNAFELNKLFINQKVISLGVIRQGEKVPHINYLILIGEFKPVCA